MSSTAPPSPVAARGAGFPLRVRVAAYLLVATVIGGIAATAWVVEMRSIRTQLARHEWPRGAHSPDPELGFRPTRNFSGAMLDGRYHVRTDALGSRIPKDARQDAIEPNGLVAVGCSFTYGYDVEAEQAFPYEIGQLLEIPSYNFGVCAYSYVTAVLLVKQLEREGTLAKLAPQFLVLGAGSWLEDRSRSPFYPSDSLPFTYPYLRNQDGKAAVARAPSAIDARYAFGAAEIQKGDDITLSRSMVLASLVPRVWFARIYSRTLPDPGSQATLSDRAIYEFVAGELGEIARRHNMRLAILWLPHHEVEAVNPTLVQVLSTHSDVILIDGNDAMRHHRVPSQEFADRHPSVLAHAGYARHVAEILRPLKRGR